MTERLQRAVLAFDQGGHASRCCVVDADGTLLAEAQVPIRTQHSPDDRIEHDADELVSSLQQAACAALGQATEKSARSITAAGLATQRSTLVCFDRRDARALSPAISWQDRRNAAWLASFADHAERIRALTGLPLSPHYGVGKMRWCLEHLPAVQAAARDGQLQMAPLSSFLAARLTGRAARVDPANACRTLLWDRARHDWSAELLELFGIQRAWLPPCERTCANFGPLQLSCGAGGPPPSAAGPGNSRIELRAVTGDQSAVPFAAGAPDLRAVYVNLGTGAFLQRPTSQPPADASPLLASVLALDAQIAWYCLEGSVNGAGSAISAFLPQQPRSESALWRELDELAPEADLPIYINGIGGLGSPYWRPLQPSYFIGAGTAIERFAAVLESIVFLIATNFDHMRAAGGPPQRVLASGGLSRSDWLCRRLAATLDVTVLRTVQEATVLGVAALADAALFAACAASRASPERFEPRALAAGELGALRARRARFDAALAS